MTAEPATGRVRREARAGAEGGFCMAALSQALEPALLEAAGEGATCVSVSLEFATLPSSGVALMVEAWVERATRTLVFAAAEAKTADGTLAGSATAIFNRP